MSSETLEQSVKRVLVLQLILTVVLAVLVVLGYWITEGSLTSLLAKKQEVVWAIAATSFGSLLAIVGTGLSARSVHKSSEASMKTPQLAMVPVYAGTFQKLLLPATGTAFGPIQLGLSPIMLILGYLVVHVAYIIAMVGRY